MALYAIGDLHFSPQNSKPMDIFGWENHKERILAHWVETVRAEDVVMIAGDISWALRYPDARENLDEIAQLPGKKILIKGNHDYWWQSLTKMRNDYPELFFLQNNCYMDEQYLIFGARGWDLPGSKGFTEEDQRIYDREKARLGLSMRAEPKDSQGRLRVAMLHYPPVLESQAASEITDLLAQNNITQVVYGHLHGADSFRHVYEGQKGTVQYHLVSADYLAFQLKRIAD